MHWGFRRIEQSSRVVEVGVKSCGGHLEQATGAETYTGPARVSAQGTTQVDELARVEDFEAVLRWVAGVKRQAPFRVTTLTSPPRVVIDVVG